MYLINVNTLTLEEFFGEVPPYAILSHTWGKEEVTFRDFADLEKARKKQGFKKIRRCIRQAKADGLSYCWVDTCCIDKSSSAELSEAINSMFSWYRNSKFCYIYLVDVDSRQEEPPIELQFQKSRWFTRGWTLQELLAPRVRKFYDTNWVRLFSVPENPRFLDSTRLAGLRTGLPAAAGVSEETLDSFSPTSRRDCVAVKMSWAASRRTTRVEDMAYCLMGIFDINMPLLYGEGAKAFVRLQEEIIKKTYDHSIFCWADSSAAPSRLSGLLANSPTAFSGLGSLRFAGRPKASLEGKRVAGKPYAMTNRGLSISLPMVQKPGSGFLGAPEFYARLDFETGIFSPRSHYLVLADLGMDGQYMRVDIDKNPKDTRPGTEPAVSTALAEMKEIFVPQEMSQLDGLAPDSLAGRLGKITFLFGGGRVSPSLLLSQAEMRCSIVRLKAGDLWTLEGDQDNDVRHQIKVGRKGTANDVTSVDEAQKRRQFIPIAEVAFNFTGPKLKNLAVGIAYLESRLMTYPIAGSGAHDENSWKASTKCEFPSRGSLNSLEGQCRRIDKGSGWDNPSTHVAHALALVEGEPVLQVQVRIE